MDFFIKIIFYTLWAVTGFLSFFYLKEGFSLGGSNPLFMKQWLALGSLLTLYLLYQGYQLAEGEARYGAALIRVLLSWVPWIVTVGVIFLIGKGYLK